ncbi:MAG TPA: hypothetical protein DHW16_00545 [Ruminococcaceae bacterium]|nr:hypothetical protein [Oscillospiraceae bacterium]HCO37060.1 hypothetical protein [Oscillospiraceae bacterium]
MPALFFTKISTNKQSDFSKNIIALKSAGGIVMKMNTQRNVMKCIGATLAVCSAIAMVGGTKSCSAKKTIKKTVNKMADIVDSVTAFM